MFAVLLVAGIYNVAWGALVVLAPEATFRWCGFPEAMASPPLWRCIGMIVGVYGIGYAIAAFDPLRHWPVVLVGLLGKVFGPIGMAQAIWDGTLPPSAAKTCLTNDLIWWIPFTLILVEALRTSRRSCSAFSGASRSPSSRN